jgi:hypothetical protein
MHQRLTTVFLVTILAFALGGCESHQGKVDALQKEHDRISQQYKKDCGDEYLKAKSQFSQKCLDEAKQMDDVWKQLQAEKAK